MISLRPYAVADAQDVYAAVRESLGELMPWMPWSHQNYSIDESKAWLEQQVKAFEARSAFEFSIRSADGRYLGAVGLNQIDTANRRANLGYWVRSTAARRGVCTQAVQQLRDWAFANTDLMRLEIIIAKGNRASLRVAEKAGAIREGHLRKRLLINGVAHDAVVFAFTNAGDRG